MALSRLTRVWGAHGAWASHACEALPELAHSLSSSGIISEQDEVPSARSAAQVLGTSSVQTPAHLLLMRQHASPWAHAPTHFTHSMHHQQQQLRGLSFWRSKKETPPASEPSSPPELSFGDPQPEDIPVDEPVTDLQDTDITSLDAAAAISDACSQVEGSAIELAKEQSFLFGAQFIDLIHTMHTQMDLPWWASIAVANVMTRSVALPLMLISQKNTTRMMGLNVELMPLRKLQEAMTLATTMEQKAHVHKAWMEQSEAIRGKLGGVRNVMISMFGSLMVNSLVFISIFNGVNNLMVNQAPSLMTGGMLWFPDLTLPDPYYGLPVLCTLSTLGLLQYGMSATGDQMASPQKAEAAARVKNIFRFMALMFIPFGHYVPSGVAMLWASNSLFSIVVGTALRQNAIRRLVGLPDQKTMTEISDKLQELQAADPWSFVPPMPQTETAPGPAPTTPPVTPPPPADAPTQHSTQ